ncbi:MAG: hypothetical protein V7L29_14520 [Nostoc sp.]
MFNLFSQAISAPWSIIRQAIAIYRANFPLFLKMALYCTAWFLAAYLPWLFLVSVLLALSVAPYVFLASPSVFAALFSHLPSEILGSVLIAAVVILMIGLGLSPFTSAKGLLRQTLISQVAYQTLRGQPETILANLRHLRSRFWQFWLAEVYINGVLTAIGHLTSRLGEWLVLGLSIAINIWFTAQWFLVNLVIAIEDCNVRQALRISRERSKPHMLTICCTLFGTGVLTVPLYLLAFSPAIAVWLAEKQDLFPTLLNAESLLHLILALGLSIILTVLFHTLAIPLWQSIKALLYCYLRSSKLTST